MIRVLALLPYPLGCVPGQRYRIEQWEPLLRSDGIEITFSPFLSTRDLGSSVLTQLSEAARGYLKRLTEILRPAPFDMAFVYREAGFLGPALIERALAHRLPFIFDFDDAIHLRPPVSSNLWARALRPPAKTGTICKLARHVTVGNEYLARMARRVSRSVTVIPTTIDTDAYVVRERADNELPIVGWTGSPTTLCYLETIAGALRRLAARVDFELRIIGGQVEVPGVKTRCLPWKAETEAEDVRPFDVGLMPLVDDEWCQGKCGLKALQYMALGIPPVVSPLGVGTEIVRNGVNGFHANTENDWVERIEELLRTPDLRRRFGREARRTVEERFSARVQAPRLAQIFRNVAADQRRLTA
jgi:glycosyltransferase involved in cell wall biosynthesis